MFRRCFFAPLFFLSSPMCTRASQCSACNRRRGVHVASKACAVMPQRHGASLSNSSAHWRKAFVLKRRPVVNLCFVLSSSFFSFCLTTLLFCTLFSGHTAAVLLCRGRQSHRTGPGCASLFRWWLKRAILVPLKQQYCPSSMLYRITMWFSAIFTMTDSIKNYFALSPHLQGAAGDAVQM